MATAPPARKEAGYEEVLAVWVLADRDSEDRARRVVAVSVVRPRHQDRLRGGVGPAAKRLGVNHACPPP